MRAYNEQHPADPVRFVGLDISRVDTLAYDAVADHVQRTAPHRLDELQAYYATLQVSHADAMRHSRRPASDGAAPRR